MFYLDTSAAVKLVIAEAETPALRFWIVELSRRIVSSDLLRTELQRTIRRKAPRRMAAARDLLDSLVLMRLTTAAYETAGLLEPAGLRSLDALHLVAALGLGSELSGIVTYDQRLAEAAQFVGG
ncbi:MAG: type II toxin-antitoxin system VapC family toxin [bacterium]|nr:type II toxin-antitoxin system VapC family toxin [bacterium]